MEPISEVLQNWARLLNSPDICNRLVAWQTGRHQPECQPWYPLLETMCWKMFDMWVETAIMRGYGFQPDFEGRSPQPFIVSVYGDVWASGIPGKWVGIGGKLNLWFDRVVGDVNCWQLAKDTPASLHSLEGMPREVTGNFVVNHLILESLEGGPEVVGGDYECRSCDLVSLKGLPAILNGKLDCSFNQLTTLQGLPRRMGGGLDCTRNELINLVGCPELIDGFLWVMGNPLVSLECQPDVRGEICCSTRAKGLFDWHSPVVTDDAYDGFL